MITGMSRVPGSARSAAEQLEPVDARHHHVGQHEVGRLLGDGREGLLAVGRRPHRPVRAEQPGQVGPHVGVVVDDQDAAGPRRGRGGLRRAARCPAPSWPPPRGRRPRAWPAGLRRRPRRPAPRTAAATVNVLPVPGSLPTDTLPPCSAASSCTRARPMPVPSRVRAVAPGDAVEAVEQLRQLLGDDPHAGVGDRQHEPRRRPPGARRRCRRRTCT